MDNKTNSLVNSEESNNKENMPNAVQEFVSNTGSSEIIKDNIINKNETPDIKSFEKITKETPDTRELENITKDIAKEETPKSKAVEGGVSDKEEKGRNHMVQWSGKQRLETLTSTGTSSSEDIPSTLKKTVKRRKKRPKDMSAAAITWQKKIIQIQDVLSSSPPDMETLKELAVSEGGLVKDKVRRRAWPRLMNMEQVEAAPKPPLEVVKAHKDYQQVVLDVQRSLKRFPPGIDDDYRVVLMDQLTVLIIRVLMKHPHLHYYQGYHDVAITFLLVMGEDVGFEMMEKLSVSHLREFMRPTMERTTYYLTYFYPILHRADPHLHKFINQSGVGTMFCLPWLITWFAHTLADYRNVVRLYDFFLASPYLMPMYIATAIVLQKKEDVLAGECEMAMQHYILSQVPDTLPFEDILVEAQRLHEAYPPDTLTQEVEEYVKRKTEEEKLEKQQLLERKRKYMAKQLPYKNLMVTVLNYIPVAPSHRSRLFKVALFAASVFVARGIYSYYSTATVYVTPDS